MLALTPTRSCRSLHGVLRLCVVNTHAPITRVLVQAHESDVRPLFSCSTDYRTGEGHMSRPSPTTLSTLIQLTRTHERAGGSSQRVQVGLSTPPANSAIHSSVPHSASIELDRYKPTTHPRRGCACDPALHQALLSARPSSAVPSQHGRTTSSIARARHHRLVEMAHDLTLDHPRFAFLHTLPRIVRRLSFPPGLARPTFFLRVVR